MMDRDWLHEFVVELRLQGASGRAIGDAVAEVEAHCAESGQSPRDAFGDPDAYARSLELPDTQRWSRGEVAATFASVALLTVGIAIGVGGVLALVAREDASFGLGAIVAMGGVLVVIMLMLRTAGPVVRFVTTHPILAIAAWVVVLAAVVALAALVPDPQLTVPAWMATGAGAAIIALAVMVYVVARRRGVLADDPIIAPEPRG